MRDASETVLALVLSFAGECDDGTVRVVVLLDVGADGVVVFDGAVHAVGDHHGAGLAVDLAGPEYRLVEVVHHDLGFAGDRVPVPFDVPAQPALGAFGVELRVVVNRFHESEVTVDGGVAAQHVEDEALLDGLLHRVRVERQVLDGAIWLRRGVAEQLEGLVLRRGREGEVAGVGEHAVTVDETVYLVLEGVLVIVARLAVGGAEGCAHGRSGASALAGVGFVDDDGKLAAAVFGAHRPVYDGEFLDGS